MHNQQIVNTFGIFELPGNLELIGQVEASGSSVVRLPAAIRETIAPGDTTADHLNGLRSFDWLIFTDAWAVESFFEIAEKYDADLAELDDIRICSIGESTASRLRPRYVHSDITTSSADVTVVSKVLSDYSGGLFGQRMLVVQGNDARIPNFGTEHVRLKVYRSRFSRDAETAKFRALLIGGLVDAIATSSIDDVFSVKKLFALPSLDQSLAGMNFYAVDADSRQALLELGLRTRHFRL